MESNSGSVPSANSRLSPLPPELFNHQATIDIPLHNAKVGRIMKMLKYISKIFAPMLLFSKGRKSKVYFHIQAKEDELKRREQLCALRVNLSFLFKIQYND
ncbi:Secretory carrier-associated membrane protein 5 [Glycine soja]